jgi:hypothetical protein
MTVQAELMQSLMDPRVAEPSSPPLTPGPQFELIELLFFAYRDFVGDPDRLPPSEASARRVLVGAVWAWHSLLCDCTH